MGNCRPGKKYKTISIEHSMLALLLNDRTQDCLNLMQVNNNIKYSEPISMINDNLLHYACKKNNAEVVRYILSKDPQAASKKNKYQKYPHNLATSTEVLNLFPKTPS